MFSDNQIKRIVMLFSVIAAAEDDRENRGKSTVLPEHWQAVMKAAEEAGLTRLPDAPKGVPS